MIHSFNSMSTRRLVHVSDNDAFIYSIKIKFNLYIDYNKLHLNIAKIIDTTISTID